MGLYSAIRPFGATLLMGSWDKQKGAGLYCIEPSGVGYGYWGCAAGKAKSNAKTEIEKLKMKDMTCAELIKEAAKIIYMVPMRLKTKCLSWSCHGLLRPPTGFTKECPMMCTLKLRNTPSLPWKKTPTPMMRTCLRFRILFFIELSFVKNN